MRTVKIGLSMVGAVMLLAGCGGSGGGNGTPDAAQVKKDFDSPSGKTSDKTSVVNAAAGASSTDAVGALSSIGAGFGLSSPQLNNRAFAFVRPENLLGDFLSYLNSLSRNQLHLGLRTEASSNCGSEITTQLTNSLQKGNTSGDFGATIDMSKCQDGATGTLDVSGHYDFSNQQNASLTINEKLNNVCVLKNSNKLCVNGSYGIDFSGVASGGSGANAKVLFLWNLTATGVDGNGKAVNVTSKGGMRYSQNGTQSSGSLEYLLYVKDAAGKEVSLKLTFGVQNGMKTLTVTGADGSTTCVQAADGSGSCTSTSGGMLSWTAADYAAATK